MFRLILMAILFHKIISLELLDIYHACNGSVWVDFKKTGTNNGNTVSDINITVSVPIGNDYLVGMSIFVLNKGKWTHVFDPPKTAACKTLDLYVGATWYRFQQLSGVTPKTCPVQGRFLVHNFEIDLKSIRFPWFPQGLINVTSLITYKSTKKVVGCINYIVKNVV